MEVHIYIEVCMEVHIYMEVYTHLHGGRRYAWGYALLISQFLTS